MNQVAVVGNITDDPELRYTQSGAALAGVTVDVSHRSEHNGEWQDVNDGFFHCTAWPIGRRERSAHPQERDADLRCRQARPGQLAGQRRQQASDRRDPGHSRRTGPPVRYRRSSKVPTDGLGSASDKGSSADEKQSA